VIGAGALAAAGLSAVAVYCAFPAARVPSPRTGALAWIAAGCGAALLLALALRPSVADLALGAVLGGAAVGVLLLRGQVRARAAVAERRVLVQGFCEELSAGLAAGLPVTAALDGAVGGPRGDAVGGAHGPEARGWTGLDGLATTQRMGGSVPDALRRLARAPGAGDLRLVAASWQVAHRSGASLAAALDAVAGTVRERQRTRRMVASELASARATARLMAGLPVFTLAMGSGAGGDPVGFLLATPLGLACLAAGLLLTLCGLWWIEAIAAGIEREVR
jgi:tight adherence protein B